MYVIDRYLELSLASFHDRYPNQLYVYITEDAVLKES